MFNQIILKSLLTATFIVLAGCSSGGSGGTTADVVSSLSGIAQKGAFLKDSNVSLCKLDEKMSCTSDVLESKVSDDKGSYEFKTLPWSGLSRLSISGYYLDELTGTTSLSPATITAIVDIQSNVKQKTNTNLLTDMRAKRMKNLVDKGKSIDEASDESKDDVKKLFNVSSDDFTALDLVDFSQGSASVNVELLRISAAVSNAQDPVATLEELMKIYNEYGIEAVLNSTLYKTLMGLIKNVDVKEVLSKMTSPEDANAAAITDIAPFAIANIVTYGAVNFDTKVRITLIGTEFTGTPSISVSSKDNLLGIDVVTLSDDNRSAILDMNVSTSCEDINLSFTIDYMTLKDVADPMRIEDFSYKNGSSICNTSAIANDPDTSTPVVIAPTAMIALVPFEDKKIKLTLLGTEFESYEGSINAELITSSDTLAIESIVVSDNNKSAILTFNEATNYCAENNVTIGLYTFNLKDVTNQSDTFKSNKIRYVSPNTMAECGNSNSTTVPVPFNRAPTVTITPSIVSQIGIDTVLVLNAVAEDVNTEDRVTLQWRYKNVESAMYKSGGTSSQFSQWFERAGRYIVDVNATDNHGASSRVSIEFDVVAVNHSPEVTISPDGDKNIYVGESLILKSLASDEDGDTLTISWKIKESNDTEFTTVTNYGTTGFNHTFNTAGSYLVVVEAVDGNASTADANITVVVSDVPTQTLTLDDINITLTVKGTKQFSTGVANGANDVILHEASTHGDTRFFLVGNEFWNIVYESTDCYIGDDSFIYKHGNDYGRVNVTITSASNLSALSETKTLFNTQTLEGEYLRAKSTSQNVEITTDVTHGDASFIVVGNEFINYYYDPEDSYVGSDYLEYNVSETIDSCVYSELGRIDFIVQEYVPQTKLLGICQDPYTIGSELYKTDGTLSGTSLVKNINSNERNGVGWFVSDEYKIGNLLFFHAYDGDRELWQSDGVTTYENKINSTYESQSRGSSNPQCFNMIDNKLYFVATNGDNSQYGIYIADGNSVVRVSDNKPSGNEYNYCSEMPYSSETSSIYFWEDDSVDSNISRLKKANMDFSTVETVVTYEGYAHNAIATLGENVFYQVRSKDVVTSGAANLEIWMKTPTTDATEILNGEYQFVQKMLTAEGKVYAMGRKKAFNDDVFDAENRKMRLFEITATDAREVLNTINGDMRYIEYLDGSVYFMAWHFDQNTYDEFWDLYRYNIATQEKTLLKTITRMEEGNPNHSTPMMQDMFKFEDRIFVRSIYVDSGDNPLHRDQLWVSDGTVDGTIVMHENIIAPTASSLEYKFFTINGEHFMQDKNLNVYKTDYTLSGTSLVIPNSCDITPDNFSVESRVDYELSTLYEQNATITGISYSATKVSIENGEYSIGDRTHWTTAESTISNGQVIYFRHTSSNQYETTVTSVLSVGDMDMTFSTTTKPEAIVGGNTVQREALMWEDTEHTRGATMVWSDANSYCADLTLDGYDDWRLPNFSWSDGINEMGTIMIGSGESAAGDRVIDEGFVLITKEDNIWSWTNEAQGDTSHVVGIFSGGSENFDGLGDTELVGVRCVRDVEQ